MKTSVTNTQPYTTKDHSTIRELLHPDNSDIKNQSIAEATIAGKQKTSEHFHKKTEEIYFILSGCGVMFLNEKSFEVKEGDSILIKPGEKHCIENTEKTDLKILCCCSPAYQHEDTYLSNQET